MIGSMNLIGLQWLKCRSQDDGSDCKSGPFTISPDFGNSNLGQLLCECVDGQNSDEHVGSEVQWYGLFGFGKSAADQ